jgi:hypothetical protein
MATTTIMVAQSTYPRITEDVVWREEFDRILVCHLSKSTIRMLDPVATSVWKLCDGARSIEDIVMILGEEFDVDMTQLKLDVTSLILELCDTELLSFK